MEKVVKSHKLPVIGKIKIGDVMYSAEALPAVWNNGTLLRDLTSFYHKGKDNLHFFFFIGDHGY